MVPAFLALTGCSLHLATALLMFGLSGAPGWTRLRTFGFVALSAAAYSGVDVWAAGATQVPANGILVVRLNMINAALHASAWLFFTFSNERGSWSELAPRVKAGIVTVVGLAIPIALFTDVADPAQLVPVTVRWLGVQFFAAQLSALGNLVGAIILATLLVSYAEHARRWWRGVPGAGATFIGFTIFFLCAIEEYLVAAGVVSFIFLSDVGFMAVVIPVTVLTLKRFRNDAARLAELTDTLSDAVEARTNERDRARRALEEQERLAAIGRMAAGVGHEVNNPLGYVAANLEFMRDEDGARRSPESQVALDDALDGVRRIRSVVDNLRAYSTASGGSYLPVSLAAVASDAVRVATALVLPDVPVEVANTDVTAHGDAVRLVEVGVNLIVNASQAAHANRSVRAPRVRVETRAASDGWAEFIVTDSGAGFEQSVLARIGEPYVTTRANDGGTGLGLFVSRGAIDAHGGALHIETDDEGNTRVRVRFPPARRRKKTGSQEWLATPTSTMALSADARGRGTRVLLVDDEPMLLRGLTVGLTRLGLEVDGHPDAASALAQLARDSNYAVVVSDLMMPGISGIEFAEELARAHPQLRSQLIIMTGGATTDQAQAFLSRDDVRMLPKPLDVRTLYEAIVALTETPPSHSAA